MRKPTIAVVLLLGSCPAWASPIIQDFSFEDPLLGGAGAYSYRPTGTAWDFGPGSDGIVSVGPADVNFGMTSAASGSQAAFIQRVNSQISQTISGLTIGMSYRFNFFAATRPDMANSNPFYGGGEDFNVLWNGDLIGYYLPTSTSFVSYPTNWFIATATSGVLMFQGIDSNTACNQSSNGCDRTAFIDDVAIVTPEPLDAVLLLSGILLINFGLRRKAVSRRASGI
ncbi:MAG: hypothetical protein P4L56_21485 [Candidatus Sulfopaludibacter sp.]|nr:hypothetical protein [Candidatus Sulfopaludibacter sp.]